MVDFGEGLPGRIEAAVLKVPESEQALLREQITDGLRPEGNPDAKNAAEFTGYVVGGFAPIIGSMAFSLLLRKLAAADSEIITGIFPKMVVAGSSALLGIGGVMGGIAIFDNAGSIVEKKFATISEKVTKFFEGRRRQLDVERWLSAEGIME